MTPLDAGLLGLALGALLTGLVWWLSRRRDPASGPAEVAEPADEGPRLPEGVADVLGALRSGGVVLDREGRVQTASATAMAYGLVRRERLAHEQLRRLAARTLQDGTTREAEFELPLSPIAGGRMLLAVRVAPLAEEHVLVLV